MIISHRHKFIFLHCRKAAGSSITVSLARYLGDNDIQIGSIVDAAEHHIRPPKWIVRDSILKPSWPAAKYIVRKLSFWHYVNAWAKQHYAAQLGGKPAHASARLVKSAFPTEWDEYATFCSIRNPWDKTVSDYFWRTKGRPGGPTFSDYVRALSTGDTLDGAVPNPHYNWDTYAIDGRVAVDKVIKYENLIDDLDVFLRSIGLEWDRWMPKSKSQYRTRAKRPSDYRSMYNDADAEIIGNIYREEIAFGDYKF